MEKSILENLVNEDKELSNKIEKAIIEVVKANGGFIDMRETDGKDKCYVILDDEEHQRYSDCFVNAVAIFDGSLCVLTTELSKYPYEGEKDELLESDEWMSISGGMFWRNASLVALAETIEQYVEKQKGMKANEVMVGDYVHCITDDTIHKIARINVMGKFVEFDEDNYTTEPNDFLNVLSDVDGVPLTDEILKKNGFIIKDIGGTKYAVLDGDVGVSFRVDFFEEGWAMTVFSYLVNMKYVHQLQHALRLCGKGELADKFVV